MKKCKVCGEEKPLDAFYKRANGTLETRCKSCRRKISKQNKAKYKVVDEAPTKVCKKCGVEQPITNFHKDSSYLKGRKHVCNDCINEQARLDRGEFWVDGVNIYQVHDYEKEEFNDTLKSLASHFSCSAILKYLVE